MPEKSFDRKLAALRADPSGCREFILWDAKDADLGLAPGREALRGSPEWPDASFPYRSLGDLADKARALVLQCEIDVMLVSDAVGESLSGPEELFARSRVTPAVRFSAPVHQPALRPVLRPADREVGPPDGPGSGQVRGPGIAAGPVVYGLRLSGDPEADTRALDRYERFRYGIAGENRGHVLELIGQSGWRSGAGAESETVGKILSHRLLHDFLESGRSARPLLVNAPYCGPRLTEQLAAQLPGMPLGIVGGAPGTSYDAFNLVAESKKHGVRSALLGRKIAQAEHQLAFVRMLRVVAEGDASPAEAVHAYHGVLEGLGIRPRRKIEEDTLPTAQLWRGEDDTRVSVLVSDRNTPTTLNFGSPSARERRMPAPKTPAAEASPFLTPNGGEPDFDEMSVQEKLEYNQHRRDKIFG